MLSTWWWVWLAVMFLFLVPSVGYGWGYRGWGPPYPRHLQRRRAKQAAAARAHGSAVFDHHAWGMGGDIIWAFLVLGTLAAVTLFLWR